MSNTVRGKPQEVEKFETLESYFGKSINFDLLLARFLARLEARTGKTIVKIQRYVCGPEGAAENQRGVYTHRRVKVMFDDGTVKRYWYRFPLSRHAGWQIYKSAVKSRW
ncbi:MAG: hypothetical protein QUS07_07135 [Methanothrix sp.]|nr:hypothetical protein [Methanothrix sp.]